MLKNSNFLVKSSERFKALPIELESWAFSMLLMGEKLLQISFFLKIRQSVRPVRHFCRTVSRSAEKWWNLLFLDRLSSYSGFRSGLGWEVMKQYYLNDILPLMTLNDLKLLKNGKKSLKIAVKLELCHLLTK